MASLWRTIGSLFLGLLLARTAMAQETESSLGQTGSARTIAVPLDDSAGDALRTWCETISVGWTSESVWLEGTDSEVHLTNREVISHQILGEAKAGPAAAPQWPPDAPPPPPPAEKPKEEEKKEGEEKKEEDKPAEEGPKKLFHGPWLDCQHLDLRGFMDAGVGLNL